MYAIDSLLLGGRSRILSSACEAAWESVGPFDTRSFHLEEPVVVGIHHSSPRAVVTYSGQRKWIGAG